MAGKRIEMEEIPKNSIVGNDSIEMEHEVIIMKNQLRALKTEIETMKNGKGGEQRMSQFNEKNGNLNKGFQQDHSEPSNITGISWRQSEGNGELIPGEKVPNKDNGIYWNGFTQNRGNQKQGLRSRFTRVCTNYKDSFI